MISVVICAAGKGTRAGFAENKLFYEYEGLPVLVRTVSAFAPYVDEIVVACAAEDQTRVNALLTPFSAARTVVGGETRGESVFNALTEAKGDIVLVHDGARPFVGKQVILDCIQGVKEHGSAVCALPATDTTVLAQDGKIITVPPRSMVYTVQTPQGFYREEILSAYRQAFLQGRTFTDESSVYAAYITSPHIFIGERTNKKLTYREDFALAERVGFGVDTHAFGKEQNYIVLAGVSVPSKSGLIAHSDGDVLVHALMDALLSAAGLRDIGYYFPDTDEAYRGADSMKLLERVMQLVKESGYAVKNASVSVLAEKPRLSPYIDEMKQNLSAALGCEESAVAVAAGTNEKLGYVGEGKGITVYATVLLK